MNLACIDSHYAKYASNESKDTSPQTHFTNKTPIKKLNILTRKQPSNFGIDHGIAHMLWIILAIAKAVHPVVHYIIICSLLIITFHLNIFDFLAEFAMQVIESVNNNQNTKQDAHNWHQTNKCGNSLTNFFVLIFPFPRVLHLKIFDIHYYFILKINKLLYKTN